MRRKNSANHLIIWHLLWILVVITIWQMWDLVTYSNHLIPSGLNILLFSYKSNINIRLTEGSLHHQVGGMYKIIKENGWWVIQQKMRDVVGNVVLNITNKYGNISMLRSSQGGDEQDCNGRCFHNHVQVWWSVKKYFRLSGEMWWVPNWCR